ncbi:MULTISPECIES: alpha/beta fold hydrolase [unclassified Clostridioides]|uniref:alpha/beta fold hydrolase n=1 Tax=unclassified Clostridioides TaxID=2635829 RepID=UPI001D0F74EF|nr:alpha/beta hydrolase [Clostridioides sp. ZZV14-6045]MCC0730476.1 alpha/beta hydrolase [Clostridioides sp. ZZV14-6048]MCC0739399.1 alpha/beta hydrolase [Clostridioides sp. ZZV14-5902]WLD29641.1 hypothetical protein CDIFMA2_35360 [Clostridioides difficile]
MKKFIEINGKKNFIYSYGQGSITLVLLSGSGIPFPNFEYMSLAKTLAKTYRVIGIEKLGYGHSDLSENNRNINVVVHEYRCILQELGIKTPIVLVAHSVGFLEALRWGQQNPSEIAGIIGIDPATPECYNRDFNIDDATNKLIELSNDEHLRKVTTNALIEQLVEEHCIPLIEKKELENVLYHNLANQNWISEAKNLRNTIALIERENPYLQIPMLFFISNGEGTGIEKQSWINHPLQYLNNIKIAQYELFDYPHNLYKFVYKEIAEISEKFLSKYLV